MEQSTPGDPGPEHAPREEARPASTPPPPRRPFYTRTAVLGGIAVVIAVLTFIGAALVVSIFHRKEEARTPYLRMVEVTEATDDPAVWGANWPRQYDSYRRTVDYERTRYGGSDAIPKQKLDQDPWLRAMWAGYAFSLDYRESRGHAWMLHDQDHTERVLQRPQPGACLHCHSSVLNIYRYVGDGDIFEGFRQVNQMTWNEARNLTDAHGNQLVQHPASCVDCHDPQTMEIRVTRPAFLEGIQAYKAFQGVEDYDVNRDATRQEMRTFVCAQCHVEYYFTPDEKRVTYPWAKGIRVEQIEAYYDEIGFADWQHAVTGALAIKAQHPEFELWSQGAHAQAGVTCADCHMPYRREGAMKVSDHHVRSPLLDVAASCQTCHRVSEDELLRRAHAIQDRTQGLVDRSGAALMDMINTIAAARAAGATDEQLAPALELQRKAQWRLDFVYSEGSRGFHASQESARILAEALDFARQAQFQAKQVHAPQLQRPSLPEDPVIGVTPDAAAPPGAANRNEPLPEQE